MNTPPLPTACPLAAAVAGLAKRLPRIAPESVPLREAAGRALAEDLAADRDSPACDVSAMDGFAFSAAVWSPDRPVRIAGVCAAGSPAAEPGPGEAVRIFTGAAVPLAADCVVERELAEESEGSVRFTLDDPPQPGRNVRRRGENAAAGSVVLRAGTLLTPAAMAAIASFAPPQIRVRPPLRVAILNTGDELVPPGEPVKPWQIRDSNGPVLEAMIDRLPYAALELRRSVADDPEQLRLAIDEALRRCDVLLLTGGVSAGDYDYVPAELERCGVQRSFHRLPLRPGRPIYGGVGPDGQLVCGLPGNPVSVAVTARRLAIPLMRYKATGEAAALHGSPLAVPVEDDHHPAPPLVWFRLVRIGGDGRCTLLANRGSGDLAALAASDGFAEWNPFVESPGNGQRLFYGW